MSFFVWYFGRFALSLPRYLGEFLPTLFEDTMRGVVSNAADGEWLLALGRVLRALPHLAATAGLLLFAVRLARSSVSRLSRRAAPLASLVVLLGVGAVRPAAAQIVIDYDSASHRPGQQASLSYGSSRNRIARGPQGERVMRPPNEVDLTGDGITMRAKDVLVTLHTVRQNTIITLDVRAPAVVASAAWAISGAPVRLDSLSVTTDRLSLQFRRPLVARYRGDTLHLRLLPEDR